jgi:hypothetical protein
MSTSRGGTVLAPILFFALALSGCHSGPGPQPSPSTSSSSRASFPSPDPDPDSDAAREKAHLACEQIAATEDANGIWEVPDEALMNAEQAAQLDGTWNDFLKAAEFINQNGPHSSGWGATMPDFEQWMTTAGAVADTCHMETYW